MDDYYEPLLSNTNPGSPSLYHHKKWIIMASVQQVSETAIQLPPDQSLRMYKRPNELLILSVAEDGVSIGMGSSFGTTWSSSTDGFHIFAERIRLADSFKLGISSSSSRMTLSTHTLQLSNGSASVVDISGANGTNNDTGGQPDSSSIDGNPAGALSVYVESCDAIAANNLVLRARGGDGGNTRQSAGKAGDGGDGGQVQFLSYSSRLDLCQMLYQLSMSKTYNDRSVVFTNVTPLSPFASDIQSALNLAESLPDWPTIASIMQPIDHVLKQISTTSPPTYDEALEQTFLVARAIEIQGLDEEANVKANTSVDGGYGGSAEPPLTGGPRGSPGDRGKLGDSRNIHHVTKLDTTSTLSVLRQQSAVFVHPEQCQMLFDRAMTYWYFGYQDSAIGLLRRLLLRLAFLPVQPTDPLYQAYQEHESSLHCLRSISKLTDLHRTSTTQLSTLISGDVDFYGHRANWVPRVSYTTYQNFLDSAMNVFKQLETSYTNYHAALEQQETVKDVVDATKANIDSSSKDLDDEIQSLVEHCKDLDVKINVSGQEVEALHRDFQKAYEAFEDQIEKSHYLETRDVINAVCDLISTPWARLMSAGTTAAKMGYDWYNLAETDTLGFPVSKKYLLESLRRSTITSRADLTIDFNKDDLSGEFQVDGRVDKFVVEKEKLEQILAEFSTTQFAALGDDLLQKFQKFIDALMARNDDIVEYNNTLQAILDRISKKKKIEQMKAVAEKDVIIDDDLEEMTDYMRLIYDNARARVMRYISLGQRALTYKVLKKEDLLQLSGVNVNGDIPLSITSDVLAVVRSNLDDLLLRATEENSNAPADFPATARGTGKRRYLAKDELDTFLRDKRISISIPPVFPDQLTNTLNGEFVGNANVRVYRVKFILTGLLPMTNSTRSLFRAEITHAGPETIVSRRGIPSHFDHDPLKTLYSYNVMVGGGRAEQDDGRLVNKPSADDKDSTFGAPGPFTTWTVDTEQSDWSELDTHSITEGFLEFEGANYAFF